MVNRLKPWIHYLISNDHNVFTPSRVIKDNIVIVYKVFHYLKTSPSRMHTMALKLNIYKVYNQVD